jgi:hypothetical protein
VDMCDISSHDQPLTAEEAVGRGRGQPLTRAARGSRFRSSGAARGVVQMAIVMLLERLRVLGGGRGGRWEGM